MFRYFLIIGTISLWTAIWVVLVILARFIDGTGRLAYRTGRRWAWGVLKISNVKVVVEGQEKINENDQYIFISNHSSAFDIPSMYWGVKNKHGMLAKKQLKYVPFFGWAMWAAGHYFVDRKDHRAALAVMEQVAAQMSENKDNSLIIFAEGTRSEDGHLQRFKKGAFILSLDTGIPIVPVVINGAHVAMGKKQRQISSTTIKLTILPPMNPNDYSTETRNQYLADAKALFEEHYIPPKK